jgi:murein DD-endopeptidase MepM/ murein hydrolase activator NlpD
MQEFDARRPPARYAPRIIICLLGIASLILAWELTVPSHGKRGTRLPDSSALAALQNEAFTQAEAQPGFGRPEPVSMKIAPGETFQQALMRLGLEPGEAQQAVHTLGGAMDIIHIKAGLAFQAAVARPRDRRGPVRLIGLSMQTGPATAITLSRTFDGALRLREMEEEVRQETTVAQGKMSDSLYASALQSGATPELTAEVVKLFSHKLDFSRDIHPGDRFRMVFDRKVTESGRTVEGGDLLYAEIGAKGQVTRFYRFMAPGASQAEYFDETGKNIRGFLLKTPVEATRISSGFGMRLHPVLGYTRMHTGIDFAAPTGTPVFAAGDGVVQEASWKGGYGRWLQIRHNGQWSTGYGHLSGWAVRVGQHVHQGQVVGYVGASGLATGPHLHYEVMLGGQKINPKGAKVPQGQILEGRELVAFRAEKSHIDALLGGAAPREADARLAQASTAPVAPVLRGEQGGGGGLRIAAR